MCVESMFEQPIAGVVIFNRRVGLVVSVLVLEGPFLGQRLSWLVWPSA
jgi:hypothetical protein